MLLLETALQKKELLDFLLGSRKEYFSENREFSDEPNDYYYLWQTQVVPYLQSHSSTEFYLALKSTLHQLLNFEKDSCKGLYVFISVLMKHYFFQNKKGIIIDTLDISDLKSEVFKALQYNKEKMLKDKRWIGADWNKANNGEGIWGGWHYLSRKLRDELGGPDFTFQ